MGGYSAIDIGRSELATKALAPTPSPIRAGSAPSPSVSLPQGEGFAETFWIDSDIQFEPDDVDRVRSHGLPITAGIYARKGSRAIAAHTLPGTKQLGMGRGSGLVELLYAGAGFLHVRREVYETIRRNLGLPLCNGQFGRPMVPFFMPMIVPWEPPSPPAPLPKGEGRQEREKGREEEAEITPSPRPSPGGRGGQCWYLSEDYSFCERARQCGYKIMADTSIRLWHIGEYRYGWEDAGQDRPRHDSFLFLMADGYESGGNASTPVAPTGHNEPARRKPFVTCSSLGQAGRLGNQLFQIAATIGVARENGLDFVLPPWPHSAYFQCPVPQSAALPEADYCPQEVFSYYDIRVCRDTNLAGFFQSERFFKNHQAEVRQYFAPRVELLAALRAARPVAAPANLLGTRSPRRLCQVPRPACRPRGDGLLRTGDGTLPARDGVRLLLGRRAVVPAAVPLPAFRVHRGAD